MAYKRILIVTDAWHPQVNGVCTTYDIINKYLTSYGHTVLVVHPGLFPSIPTLYPKVRFALPSKKKFINIISSFNPDHIHIGTEGPLGLRAKLYCDKNKISYTTAFHTKFAEYAKKHLLIPERLTWRLLNWFHRKSKNVFVPSHSLRDELISRGFTNTVQWSHGVDVNLFSPLKKGKHEFKFPLMTYIGRVSKEKNIEAFLECNVEGTKCVVGDGPALSYLKKSYPDVVFLGELRGESLATAYANSDVFVFPSRTDTFGLVILEALSSGVPVAAYPVTGPKDILSSDKLGCMNEDLEVAIRDALKSGDRDECVRFSREQSWETAIQQFVNHLAQIK